MTILTPVIFRVKTIIDPGPPTFVFLNNRLCREWVINSDFSMTLFKQMFRIKYLNSHVLGMS